MPSLFINDEVSYMKKIECRFGFIFMETNLYLRVYPLLIRNSAL